MDGFFLLIRDLLVDIGVPEDDICTQKSSLDLPGYFRAEKQWDLIIIKHLPDGKKELVAVLELKSQKGPSFGNNINNRTEEVLRSAYDLWTAYREGAFKTSPLPGWGICSCWKTANGHGRVSGITDHTLRYFRSLRTLPTLSAITRPVSNWCGKESTRRSVTCLRRKRIGCGRGTMPSRTRSYQGTDSCGLCVRT